MENQNIEWKEIWRDDYISCICGFANAQGGVFYRAGLIETWGRGIEKIITACQEEGKPEPLFEASETGIRILFNDVSQPQVETTPEVGLESRLNDTQKKIIDLMKNDETISSETIAEKLGMTARGVRKNIETLKNLGILDRVGATKKGSWIVKSS
ncbi:MAG: HTH domain-containing protein [Bacteroidetes bacterium]|nr:HTH domain-containing protein [Bacteroidota bacterium]